MSTIAFLDASAIEQKADAVRMSAGMTTAPIDPVGIARAHSIAVFEARFPDGDVSGMLRWEQGKSQILVNVDHAYTRKRYTVAHELGHYFLHGKSEFVDRVLDFYRHGPDKEAPSPSSKRAECQANQFAAALLMPADMVKAAYLVTRNVEQLASMFNVTETAMNFRLAGLEL